MLFKAKTLKPLRRFVVMSVWLLAQGVKMKQTLIIIASLMSLTVYAGRAQNREARQQNRINQGASSGSLTQHESKKLARGQKKINAYEEKALADGTASAREKAKLEKMQDRQSHRIYKQKHDAQVQPAVPVESAEAK
jgi:hypothetical protein